MSAKRVSLDTNILIYAIDKDAGAKQHISIDLIKTCAINGDCVLTLQSLSEFYTAATRKNKVTCAQATGQLEDWQLLFPTILPSTHTINHALKAVEEHTLSFWDAMLWAVADENNVIELYSEDFQSGRQLNGVKFTNPFT